MTIKKYNGTIIIREPAPNILNKYTMPFSFAIQENKPTNIMKGSSVNIPDDL